MKVIFDTNIVVDVLQRREPWFQDGAALFRKIACRQLTGCLTAKQITDLHYFSRKQFRGEDCVDAKARQIIIRLLALFELVDVLGEDCQNALCIENGDYEDAVLIACAQRAGVDGIVTRNPEHFKRCGVTVFSPSTLLEALDGTE